MTQTATKRRLALFCAASLLSAAALAQPSAAATATSKPPATDDEIVVVGKSPQEIRLQIRLAEEAVYDRWNEINSTDDYDIHCRQETPTGSHVPRRVCQANFWRKAQAQSGTETVRALQGGPAVSPTQLMAEAIYKRRLMTREMKQLAEKDEELEKDFYRLGNLEQALDRTVKQENPFATTSAEQTAAAGALPYDAALAADVHVGRKPWTHTLRERTFTFAHVNGDIESVEVKCPGRTEKLQYETGAEWTLPADWGACDLRVDAPRGTTFSLFEFQ